MAEISLRGANLSFGAAASVDGTAAAVPDAAFVTLLGPSSADGNRTIGLDTPEGESEIRVDSGWKTQADDMIDPCRCGAVAPRFNDRSERPIRYAPIEGCGPMAEASSRFADLPFRADVSIYGGAMAALDGAFATIFDPFCAGGTRSVAPHSPDGRAETCVESGRIAPADDMIEPGQRGAAARLINGGSRRDIRSEPNGESPLMAEPPPHAAAMPYDDAENRFKTRISAPNSPYRDAKTRVDPERASREEVAVGLDRDGGGFILADGRQGRDIRHAPNGGVPPHG